MAMNLFARKLYNLAYRLCGDTTLAREFCLEAAAELGRRGFSPDASSGYLIAAGITAGLALDNGRNNKGTHRIAADDPSAGLQAALNSLPVEERVAVILRDYSGFSYDDVGSILGTGKREAGQLLSRGRFGILRRLRGEKGPREKAQEG